MNLAELVQTNGWKNFMAKLYGIGASIVIIGALFKIQHWHGAGTMLTIGLCTESIIFFFSAFEPLHEEVDWTLVYPELAGIQEEEPGSHGIGGGRYGAAGVGGGGGGSLALSKFDEMLEKADITPDLFQKLGVGMKKLGEATSNINAMGDVSAASAKYMNTIHAANDSLGRLSESYQATTRILNDTNSNYGKMAESFSAIDAGGKSYQQQLETLNKNLSALNAVYELQRKGVNDYMKESESLFKEVQTLAKNLTESSGDTKKYRDQITKLNDNLAALNNVYGNMLAAMNVK
ncbi:MAG: gliding motility protein GldL [Bacteroidota bacterium]|nr:gliding motility protein GldL [Bacteroidota bacterium]